MNHLALPHIHNSESEKQHDMNEDDFKEITEIFNLLSIGRENFQTQQKPDEATLELSKKK